MQGSTINETFSKKLEKNIPQVGREVNIIAYILYNLFKSSLSLFVPIFSLNEDSLVRK